MDYFGKAKLNAELEINFERSTLRLTAVKMKIIEILSTSHKTHSFFLVVVAVLLACVVNYTNAQVQLQVLREPHQIDGQYTYYSIACSDNNNCTVVGHIYDTTLNPNPPLKILIERTTDGGSTWIKQHSGIPNQESINFGKFLRKVIAIDSLHLFAVGDSGLVLRTTDGGSSWITLSPQTNFALQDVSFSDTQNGIVVGKGGVLLTTSNSGDTWQNRTFTPIVYARDCMAFSPSKYSILKYGTGPVYHTTNNWDSVEEGTKIPDTVAPNIFRVVVGAHYFDDHNLLAYGVHYVDGGSINVGNAYITRSSNGGKDWLDIYDNRTYITGSILTMSFNSNRGVATGNGSGILFTTDNGVTWQDDSTTSEPYLSNLVSSSFPDGDNVYFIGTNISTGGVLKLHFPSLLKTEAYEEVVYGTHLYPNPAGESVTIRTTYSDAKEIYLFDALGRKVMTIPCEGKNEVVVSCNDLPIGIYKTVISWKNRSIPGKQLVIMR